MAKGFERFTPNNPDLRRILQTDGLSATKQTAERILAIVGTEHYEIEPWVGVNRGRWTVRTKLIGRSLGHEAKHHNLVRALAMVQGA